jgi:hypothetical protein
MFQFKTSVGIHGFALKVFMCFVLEPVYATINFCFYKSSPTDISKPFHFIINGVASFWHCFSIKKSRQPCVNNKSSSVQSFSSVSINSNLDYALFPCPIPSKEIRTNSCAIFFIF